MKPADEGRLQRVVRPLAERVRELNAIFHDEEGRDLDATTVARAIAFASAHTDPIGISASDDGGLYFMWGRELSVHFLANGQTHWAGWSGGERPYGSGEPDANLWPCLRPNVGIEPPERSARMTG